MARYILRRLLIAIPLLIGVSLITFIFINLVPGDYIDTLINPEISNARREDLEPLRKQLGLDKPAPVRYVVWLSEVARGNLGYSLRVIADIFAHSIEPIYNIFGGGL